MITKRVNFPIVFSDKKATSFGGMSLMKRFIDLIDNDLTKIKALLKPHSQGKSILISLN